MLVAYAAAAAPGSFGGFNRITSSSRTSIHQFRGGAISDEYDSDEYDSDEYDSEEEEEPIVVKTKKLASSAKSVAQKKKVAAVKSKVKVAMASSSSASATKVAVKKSGGGSLYKRYVPYIVRACINPFTFMAMVKAYFVSLCDINYLKEEQSQTLRSALEEKARKEAPSGPTKPKRKMKPGQAKTISDLPQLSA
jgi:hypothetical protein